MFLTKNKSGLFTLKKTCARNSLSLKEHFFRQFNSESRENLKLFFKIELEFGKMFLLIQMFYQKEICLEQNKNKLQSW